MQERIPIDPALRRCLDEMAANAPKIPPGTADPQRAELLRAGMVRVRESRTEIAGLPNDVTTRDLEVASGLKARLFTPAGSTGLLPLLVYFHGGGWVIGSAFTTHDPACRLLCQVANVILLAVDYRLAPEHRYPAALEDAIAAYQWAATHAAELGGDPARLALGGDSSGANLAAAAANRLGVEGQLEALRAMLLICPVTDNPVAEYPSRVQNATGYGLEWPAMLWFHKMYAEGVPGDDPGAFPIHQQPLPKLPPTYVVTAEYDTLRDEGIAYAEKLKAAGTEVTHSHAPDMHHNFTVTPATVMRLPQTVASMNEVASWLRSVLAR